VADTVGSWREILCIQEDRTVGNDNTVKWERLSLQLPPSRLRPHFVKATVRVHAYPDGRLAVFWGHIGWPTRRARQHHRAGALWRPEHCLPACEVSGHRLWICGQPPEVAHGGFGQGCPQLHRRTNHRKQEQILAYARYDAWLRRVPRFHHGGLCGGAIIRRTEHEQSGQITSYQNRTH
jgi:hypothetical protein